MYDIFLRRRGGFMELLQLKYFCDAAQSENFSKTAKKFNVPTSNISQSIKRLEKELNTQLFTHLSNKIMLNEQGRKFFINAQKALDSLNDGVKAINDISNNISGEIKISACTNRRIVTYAIESFKSKYPSVSFTISHSRINEKDFDIIIDAGQFDEKYMVFPLITEEIVLAVNKSNPLANQPITSRLLKQQRFISMPKGTSQYEYTLQCCKGFIPNITIFSDDPYYIRKYVELGLGVAFFPSLSWKNQFSENVLIKKTGNISRTTYAACKSDKYISKASHLFVEELLNVAKKY